MPFLTEMAASLKADLPLQLKTKLQACCHPSLEGRLEVGTARKAKAQAPTAGLKAVPHVTLHMLVTITLQAAHLWQKAHPKYSVIHMHHMHMHYMHHMHMYMHHNHAHAQPGWNVHLHQAVHAVLFGYI